MKKLIPITVVILLVLGGGAFYGGIKYGENTRQNFAKRNLNGLQLDANASGTFPGGQLNNRSGSNLVQGEIIAKDNNSVTVKLQNGGSKIIFYSDTTEVGKFVSGTPSDLEIGKTVTINGKANQDGSITAQSIQLRPIIAPTQ